MTNLKVTQQEIADCLNISRTTVSKVFRHKPVSGKVRDAIIKKALEMGYIDQTGRYSAAGNAGGDYYAQCSRILEAMADAFYAVDSDWNLLYVNHVTEKLWGMKRVDLVGRNLWQVFPNYHEIIGSQQLQIALTEQKQASFETYSPYLKTYVEVTACPSASGGLEVYFRDVTGKKLTEEMLRTSDQLLHLAIDAAGIGFWRWEIADDKMSPIYTSPGFPAYWHMGSVKDCLASVHPGDRDRVICELTAVSRSLQHYESEHRRMLPEGKIAWIYSKGEVLRENDGAPYMLGVSCDITGTKYFNMRARTGEFEKSTAGDAAADE